MTDREFSQALIPTSLAEIVSTLASSPSGSRQNEFERNAVLVDANDDSQITQAFVQKYRTRPSTERAFRKEVTRFLFWCKLQGLTYSKVRTSHLSQYLEFCATVGKRYPQFVGPVVPQFLSNGMPNPKWKPFLRSLTPQGVSYASVVLQTFFKYMCDAKYLYGNPWKLLSDDEKRPAPQLAAADRALVIQTKSLSSDAVRILLQEIDDLRYGSELEQKHQPRASFLFRFLFCTGARRSELANAKMTDIKELSPGRFAWKVIGKGNKEGWVALGPNLIEHFKQFRLSLGLAALPQPDEKGPLIPDVRNTNRPLTGDAIYKIVKSTLILIADKLELSHPTVAAQLLKATTHWTRHTFGTELAKRNSPFLTRDQMRHSSMSTTDIYTQSDVDQRFEAVIDL
jgi:integrase/recombinase XerD